MYIVPSHLPHHKIIILPYTSHASKTKSDPPLENRQCSQYPLLCHINEKIYTGIVAHKHLVEEEVNRIDSPLDRFRYINEFTV